MTELFEISKLIRERFSCRVYRDTPIPETKRQALMEFMHALPAGPFGSTAHFCLVSATENDSQALKGLGTYGFIQNPMGFIIGTIQESKHDLEDFGYQMEQIILFATSLQLGTCWLGGSFTRSSFAHKVNAGPQDLIPAVTSIGEMIDPGEARQGLLRRQINADQRLPWETLFYDGDFSLPLSPEAAGIWATALEMIRIGPSGSNKQPWRVVKDDGQWHFFMQRSKGYRENTLTRFLGVADIQRLDMGIAMCHFELTCRELGLAGHWATIPTKIEPPSNQAEYTVSWVNQNN
jgi:nitroreductase